MQESMAVVSGKVLKKPIAIAHDPNDLTSEGYWVVLAEFEGDFKAVQFSQSDSISGLPNCGFISVKNWHSSLDQMEYESGVRYIQEQIRAGWVYQVNLCRILKAEVFERPSALGLWQRIMKQHPTKFSSFIDLKPGELDKNGLWFVSASPELFIRRDQDKIISAPIKGTAVNSDLMLEKDYAENVMITDMVRNDLGIVATVGSVTVDQLLHLEHIPGLVQLVSTVSAQLKSGISWPEIFAATFPPASVTGAPKSAALSVISTLESEKRKGYCGAFGLVQGNTAEFAVGIRSFQYLPGELRFGTGAGITLGSDPTGEWNETVLKADRLLQLASADD